MINSQQNETFKIFFTLFAEKIVKKIFLELNKKEITVSSYKCQWNQCKNNSGSNALIFGIYKYICK